MKISTIVWSKVKIVTDKNTLEWEDCTINYKIKDKVNTYKNGIAWIQQIVRNKTTANNLTFGIVQILELTPWGFKAIGNIVDGKKLIKATLEAEF